MTVITVRLIKSDRSHGYTGTMGATYRSDPALKGLDVVKEARKDAVEDGAGTAEEVATWTAEIVWPTPRAKPASFY
jgi:hypothetical protein